MRPLVALAALLLLFALGTCANAQTISGTKDSGRFDTVLHRQLLIGVWEGKADSKDGGSRTWKVQRQDDGRYLTEFKFVDASGAEAAQAEAGLWGVSGGIYFTATRGFIDAGMFHEADPRDPSLYDTYKIIRLTEKVFEYENLETGNRFTVTRVESP